MEEIINLIDLVDGEINEINKIRNKMNYGIYHQTIAKLVHKKAELLTLYDSKKNIKSNYVRVLK